MQALHNHDGELIAYQYQNMLVHPDRLQVFGLVLGNCVFGNQANILGKMFQKKVYSITGEVLASKDETSLPLPTDFNVTDSVLQAWKILLKIKEHNCPWVQTKDKWSHSSLAEYLNN